jgi:hypothetical protein
VTGRHYWALITAPDPTGKRFDYLGATLRQLAAQGIGQNNARDLNLFIDTQRYGQCWNFLRAIKAGIDSMRPWVTVLEDDIELCRGAVKRIDESGVPADCAFICWCDTFVGRPKQVIEGPYAFNRPKEPVPDAPGYVRRTSALFYCSQALTFPRSSAIAILESPLTRMWSARNEGDQLVAQVFRHDPYAVHVPSLVQHVGDLSICNPGSKLMLERLSHHYPGKDFDAATLGAFT